MANVRKPACPLDPASVKELFAVEVAAVDCSQWKPVFFEGVREILKSVEKQKSQTILYSVPPDLAPQLSLCGVSVTEDSAVIQPDCLSRGIGQCPFCGAAIRFEKAGRHQCPSCQNLLMVEDGAISA